MDGACLISSGNYSILRKLFITLKTTIIGYLIFLGHLRHAHPEIGGLNNLTLCILSFYRSSSIFYRSSSIWHCWHRMRNKNLPFKSVKRINSHHFIRIYNNRRFLENTLWPLENGSLTDYDSYEIGNRVRGAEYHDIGCVDYCERLIICYLPFDFWIRLLNLLYSIISVCNSLKVPYFAMEIGMNSDN